MANDNTTIEYKQLLDNGEPFYPMVGRSSYPQWLGYEELEKAPSVEDMPPVVYSEDLSELVEQPTAIVNLIYPIGSIYMSVNSINPSTLFGGTWEQLKDRFLLSAGDSYTGGSTGGEAEHTLTVSEMPSHEHNAWFTYSGAGNVGGNWKINMSNTTSGGAERWANSSGIREVGLTGGGLAHNNMPPYLVVYVWKRVS